MCNFICWNTFIRGTLCILKWSTISGAPTEHNYSTVIAMCICQFFQLLLLVSLWNSFMHRRFPLDRVRSGRSELLITCLFSLALLRLPPAWTVFYKRNTPPSSNLLAWHDIKRNGNFNETCFFQQKKKCLLSWRCNCYTEALRSADNSFENHVLSHLTDVTVGEEQAVMVRAAFWWHDRVTNGPDRCWVDVFKRTSGPTLR